MAFIELDNVFFSYKDGGVRTNALKGLSLSIEEGSFVSVIGPNGCGKSTFGKLLNALLVPTSGRLVVDGLDSSDAANCYEIRRRIGIVFQNPDNQIVGDTVEDDVAFGPENTGMDLETMKSRICSSMEQTGISGLGSFKPENLSGGQKQRVAIAGILALEPRCIVLDEATSMLDPKGRLEVLSAVHRLNREQGITVILITHYMEEVIDSDVVYVMSEGTIALKGTPSEVFSENERLQDIGLCLPPASDALVKLSGCGVCLGVAPGSVLTEDDLVAALVQARGSHA